MHKYSKFIKEFEEKMYDFSEEFSNIVFVCIGTNKVIGDAIGPTVGNSLKNIENDYIKVYGTMSNTMNFVNSKDIIEEIYRKYDNPYLITIDSALSDIKEKGDIVLGKGYIKIGNALDKSICFFSNVNIKCIVGRNLKNGIKNMEELHKMKIYDIINSSSIISLGIKNVLEKLEICV